MADNIVEMLDEIEKEHEILRRRRDGVEDPRRISFGDSTYPTIVFEGVRVAFSTTPIFVYGDRVFVSDMPEKNTLTLAGIVTDEESRGKGLASKILVYFLEMADKHGIKLLLEPCPIGGYKGKSYLERKALTDWYKRHGFEQDQEGYDLVLAREPH